MKEILKSTNDSRKKLLLWAVLSYILLLAMSYGFPVTGDDWYFSPKHVVSYGLFDPLVRGFEVAEHHWITTNGRLLGNFLVTVLSYSKIMRELVRCGMILVIQISVYRLSGCKGLPFYLICFSFLIAMPARIIAQTYAWAAGFFNYVPPTLLFLLYLRHLRTCFCEDSGKKSVVRIAALFVLGLSSQFFLENFTLGLCALSLGALVMLWIRRKRPDPTLIAHFLGAVIGCVIMFQAPGYQNVGSEGYREINLSLAGILKTTEENFKILSGYLTANNFLVILPLCAAGAVINLRALYQKRAERPALATFSVLAFCAYPLLSRGVHTFGRYFLAVDLAVNVMLFAALIFTAIQCVEEKKTKFVLLACVVSFVIFFSPLMVVHPVGPRNAFFFNVLLILITVILLRLSVRDLPAMKLQKIAVCLMCSLLLAGNLHIHIRNGQTEQLRKSITQQAMERGDTTITLPGYPYKTYIHGESQNNAISAYYYYETAGDITFQFESYENWVKSH